MRDIGAEDISIVLLLYTVIFSIINFIFSSGILKKKKKNLEKEKEYHD